MAYLWILQNLYIQEIISLINLSKNVETILDVLSIFKNDLINATKEFEETQITKTIEELQPYLNEKLSEELQNIVITYKDFLRSKQESS